MANSDRGSVDEPQAAKMTDDRSRSLRVARVVIVVTFMAAGLLGWWINSRFTLGLLVGWCLATLYVVAREVDRAQR